MFTDEVIRMELITGLQPNIVPWIKGLIWSESDLRGISMGIATTGYRETYLYNAVPGCHQEGARMELREILKLRGERQ